MKVYGIKNGVVQEIEIIKETKNYYHFGKAVFAFDCASKIKKENAALSVKAAAIKELDNKAYRESMLIEKLAQVRTEIVELNNVYGIK